MNPAVLSSLAIAGLFVVSSVATNATPPSACVLLDGAAGTALEVDDSGLTEKDEATCVSDCQAQCPTTCLVVNWKYQTKQQRNRCREFGIADPRKQLVQCDATACTEVAGIEFGKFGVDVDGIEGECGLDAQCTGSSDCIAFGHFVNGLGYTKCTFFKKRNTDFNDYYQCPAGTVQ